MKRTKLIFTGYAIATSLVFLSCNKQNMQQPPTKQLTTTTANLKTDATGVLLTDATALAQRFLQSKNPGKTVTIKNAETVTKNGVPYMHIVNTNNNLGYAIFSADSVYVPLLAYDSIGNFDKNNLNPGLALWFNKHGHELEFMRSAKTAYSDSIAALNKELWMALGGIYEEVRTTNTRHVPSASTQVVAAPIDGNGIKTVTTTSSKAWTTLVGPLCLTAWDQTWPWNQYCPTGSYSNGHVPAGCTPIAMAQVMYFWKWPSNYNWGIMPLTKFAGLTTDQQESARLVHDIGTQPVPNEILGHPQPFTSYKDGGSSSDDQYCPAVFGFFNYSSAQRTQGIASQILSGSQDGTAYSALLNDEINTYRHPCIVNGYSSKRNYVLVYIPSDNGHSWVCDGSQQSLVQITHTYTYYDAVDKSYIGTRVVTDPAIYNLKLLHMNWGWGGSPQTNNGWYDGSVNYSQPDANNPDFGYFQTIIYNIHP